MPSALACRIHAFGPPDVIRIEPTPLPEPGPGEVRVRTVACGVGRWDLHVRAGRRPGTGAPPLTLGGEVAGIVEAVGPGVDEFAPGDRVFGVTGRSLCGGYAEQCLVRCELLARMPPALSFVEAAALPVGGISALQMVFDEAHVVAGQRILLTGATGTVGSLALQLACGAGAEVVAAVRPSQEAASWRLRAADVVVDGAVALPGGFDAVLDTVGGTLAENATRVLRRGGRVVSCVARVRAEELGRPDVRSVLLAFEPTRARLETLASGVTRGELLPRLGRTLPLTRAVEAHDLLELGHLEPAGKIVLRTSASLP